ncbi:hypothetical protein QO010_000219 [Caulobacter ginsengisoli]|uniref:Uncharacterized protein n=1 Tax=Caulobacter ginsengisoli TaxID=400775 RepID=A0ABU0IKD4_9CAUL|nr:hypothetical protein [Caulobacter ginsengisoli]MDQ0462471.1 hypothetical protein [Caulobacter ginsengisoli]
MTSAFDLQAMEDRIKSESINVLMSIQSYRVIEPSYFDRLRGAVSDAVAFYKDEPDAPAVVIQEIEDAAQIIRNEAHAFEGRTVACLEMADWLGAARDQLLLGRE